MSKLMLGVDPTRKKSQWLSRWIMYPWVQRRLRKVFFSVDCYGLDRLTEALKSGPTVIYSNHSSWWDGLLDLVLENYLKFDLYIMMEKKRLKEFLFLERLGVFGVDLKTPMEAGKGLRTAAKILSSPLKEGRQKVVVLFSQEKITSPHRRPLELKEGVEWLLNHVPKARAIPLARRFEFINEDRPHIFLRCGPVLESLPTPILEAALEREMNLLQDQLDHFPIKGFTRIWEGGLSINKRWDYLRKRLFRSSSVIFEPYNQR